MYFSVQKINELFYVLDGIYFRTFYKGGLITVIVRNNIFFDSVFIGAVYNGKYSAYGIE